MSERHVLHLPSLGLFVQYNRGPFLPHLYLLNEKFMDKGERHLFDLLSGTQVEDVINHHQFAINVPSVSDFV